MTSTKYKYFTAIMTVLTVVMLTVSCSDDDKSVSPSGRGNWTALGTGINEDVTALGSYDNKLIAGGSFHMTGGASTNHVAVLNGTSWEALGTGTDGIVYALTSYDSKLIAGGYFDTAGGVQVKYVAAWDGSSWTPLGSGMNL